MTAQPNDTETTMTTDDLLADIRLRLNRGIRHLENLGHQTTSDTEKARLTAKASGLQVVQDWLRSYD